MKYVMLFIVILLLPLSSYSTPAPATVSGEFTQGSSIVVGGTGFLTKSPAAPLMWDDCEAGAEETAPPSAANSYSQVGYSDYQPTAVRDGDTIPVTHQMLFRDFPYTPYGETGNLLTIQAPHQYSTKALSGGHYYEETFVAPHGGRDVDITIPTAAGIGNFSTHWYARWYYRLNSDGPDCGSAPNHKTSIVQSDIIAYGGPTYVNDFFYFVYDNNPIHTPCSNGTELRYRHQADIGTCDDYTGDGTYSTLGNARDDWQIWEETIIDASTNGGRVAKVDNVTIWQCLSGGTWFTNAYGQGIGSFTLGGYFAVNVPVPIGGEQSSLMHRLYDDIYVDDTLSRVVLTNNSTYANATIIEPQIPSAWATDEITAMVNLGRLTEDIVYLFVFDSTGDRNETGVPVQLAESSTSVGPGTSSTFSAGTSTVIN